MLHPPLLLVTSPLPLKSVAVIGAVLSTFLGCFQDFWLDLSEICVFASPVVVVVVAAAAAEVVVVEVGARVVSIVVVADVVVFDVLLHTASA